ncbi:MAG TPA: tRNA (adenosine(37)-N6)-dimethylallyltransferase MiaA [Terriglobia bacterium]|nr:tRNA (adenosine(37)-N6)-dimethylallyltransferase MiaA [Terriglobia bacterium]
MTVSDFPLIAIVGPTASGKSDLALSIAEHFGGEIVNYDSVQIFRGLDIGSAKPTAEERRRVPHHMIDIRDPDDVYTAGDYQREARPVLEEIRSRSRLPILVGGTGFYLKAVIEGLFDGPQRSELWRRRMESIVEKRGREYLHRLLKRFDPEAAGRIAPRDKPKIMRALEVRLATGQSLSEHFRREPRQPLKGFRVHTIGLNPDRDETWRRIDERVVRMFAAGFVEEVRGLIDAGTSPEARAFGAIGYREIVANLEDSIPWDETIRIIQRNTRRYAKRQMTWFRNQPGVTWFDGPGDNDSIKERAHRFVQLALSR